MLALSPEFTAVEDSLYALSTISVLWRVALGRSGRKARALSGTSARPALSTGSYTDYKPLGIRIGERPWAAAIFISISCRTPPARL